MKKIMRGLLLLGFGLAACRPVGRTTPTIEPVIQTVLTEDDTEDAPVTPPSPEATLNPEEIITEQPYTGENLTGTLVFYSDMNGNPDIYLLDFGTGELSQLTDDPAFDDSPTLSPDGSRVAFLTARHDPNPKFPDLKYELYVIDSDGSNLQRLTETDAAEGHPAWSPDGSKILFDADYDGNGFAEIYTIMQDGSGLTRLTFNDANDQFADWSPDGSKIAFSSDRNGNWDIYTMDASGGNQTALTEGPDWELFPAWSPDGERIAFNFLVPQSRNTDVYVMDADGCNVRQLTDSVGFDENPAWSPDGMMIAFQTARDGNFEIYVMDQDGSNQAPLLELSSDELWPSWGTAPDLIVPSAIDFEKSMQTFASIPTWKIGLADLDGDGDLDAAFANSMQNESEIWLNDGEGYFTNTDQRLGKYGHGLDIGDLDGDGDPDVVISTHNGSPSRVYLNDGSAMFTELTGAFSSNIGFSVDLFDLDGDCDLDAVGEDQTKTNLFLNDGSGNFAAGEMVFPLTTAWGDLDDDSDVDVLVKESGVGYSVYLNDGQAHFDFYWEFADPNAISIGGMALGDIDSDGDPDVIITSGHHAVDAEVPTLVFVNDGTGQFSDSGQRLNTVKNAGVGLGDLDNDGDLDLILTDFKNPCQIWVNNGKGLFVDSGFRFSEGQFHRHIILGDLDGDGDLDIFLPTFGTTEGPNEIWFNQIN